MGKRLMALSMLGLGAVLVGLSQWPAVTALPLPQVVPTPAEQLIPTRGPALQASGRPTGASEAPTSPAVVPWTTVPSSTLPGLYTSRQRIGVGVPLPSFPETSARQLNPGWYLDWQVNPGALARQGLDYMPMIRLKGGSASPDLDTIATVAAQRPGAVWLIGNEPDVTWQDNVTPGDYARLYHDAYVFLKKIDPGCQVAIGGVSQPTPLRLRYLEAMLDAYRRLYGTPMPVDVWNVHAFILREEADSWGVGIPPGFSDRQGQLYEVKDHADMAIWVNQILAFRRWMQAHGEQGKPLIISEYGILMPADYGFPVDTVQRFMVDTFDTMLNARDPAIGYAPDGGRLVQRWCWFSLSYPEYPTGDLVRPDMRQLTPLGEVFARYVAAHSN